MGSVGFWATPIIPSQTINRIAIPTSNTISRTVGGSYFCSSLLIISLLILSQATALARQSTADSKASTEAFKASTEQLERATALFEQLNSVQKQVNDAHSILLEQHVRLKAEKDLLEKDL